MQIYRRLPLIKALSFDLDDTLYDNQPIIHNVEKQMVTWLHTHHPISANYTLEQWGQLKFELVENDPNLKHDVTLWRQTQIEQGLIRLGYTEEEASKAAKEGIQHALWLRNQIDVPEESHRTLQLLSEHFPLVAITNGNADVNQIGLDQYFDLVLRAGPDGRSKPARDMFQTASAHLGLKAENILHVGDHLISDVSGAKRWGFSACWINTTDLTLAETKSVDTLPDVEISQISELLQLLP